MHSHPVAVEHLRPCRSPGTELERRARLLECILVPRSPPDHSEDKHLRGYALQCVVLSLANVMSCTRGENAYHHEDIHTHERYRRRTVQPQRYQKGDARERVWKHRLDDDHDYGEVQRRVFVPEIFLNRSGVAYHTVTYHARQGRVQEHRDDVVCETEFTSDTCEKVAPW